MGVLSEQPGCNETREQLQQPSWWRSETLCWMVPPVPTVQLGSRLGPRHPATPPPACTTQEILHYCSLYLEAPLLRNISLFFNISNISIQIQSLVKRKAFPKNCSSKDKWQTKGGIRRKLFSSTNVWENVFFGGGWVKGVYQFSNMQIM